MGVASKRTTRSSSNPCATTAAARQHAGGLSNKATTTTTTRGMTRQRQHQHKEHVPPPLLVQPPLRRHSKIINTSSSSSSSSSTSRSSSSSSSGGNGGGSNPPSLIMLQAQCLQVALQGMSQTGSPTSSSVSPSLSRQERDALRRLAFHLLSVTVPKEDVKEGKEQVVHQQARKGGEPADMEVVVADGEEWMGDEARIHGNVGPQQQPPQHARAPERQEEKGSDCSSAGSGDRGRNGKGKVKGKGRLHARPASQQAATLSFDAAASSSSSSTSIPSFSSSPSSSSSATRLKRPSTSTTSSPASEGWLIGPSFSSSSPDSPSHASRRPRLTTITRSSSSSASSATAASATQEKKDGLQALPESVWQHAFSFVPAKHLYAVMRTSRSFFTMTSPFQGTTTTSGLLSITLLLPPPLSLSLTPPPLLDLYLLPSRGLTYSFLSPPSSLRPSPGFYHHWNLRAAEALHRPRPYISKQRHLNAKMRAILLDWVTDGREGGRREGG